MTTPAFIQVEQIGGGACDQGLRTCFDKVLIEGVFESRTGTQVFDPIIAYKKNFTPEILLGIPTGSLEHMTLKLLELAGYAVQRESDRPYHFSIANTSTVKFLMLRPQEILKYIADGLLDAGIVGMDIVKESLISVRDVIDLRYNKLGLGIVHIGLAIPSDVSLKSLKDIEGKRILTVYPNLVQQFFNDRGVSVRVIPSIGTTEGKIPVIADAIVNLIETGLTLQINNLKPVLNLYDTTTHLVASNESWSYTWKRRNLMEISSRLADAAQNLPQNPKKVIELPSEIFSNVV